MGKYEIVELETNNNLIEIKQLTTSTFEDFIKFIDAKPKTIETYKKAIKNFMLYLMENGITEPTRQDILAYRDNLFAKGNKATTIQNYITVVRLFFKWTYTSNIYPNIAEHIKGAKVDKTHKKDALTINQLKDTLTNIDQTTLKGLRDYTIILLAVSCGLRTKELSNAMVEDIRPMGNDMALYVLGKGKDSKEDYIKIPNQVYKVILNYLKSANIKNGYIFTSLSNNNSKQLTTRSISRIIKDNLVDAGYDSDRLTAHSLRHTAITLALIGGEEITRVQQFARHSNINTTMIYNHALNKAQNTCSNSIANQII